MQWGNFPSQALENKHFWKVLWAQHLHRSPELDSLLCLVPRETDVYGTDLSLCVQGHERGERRVEEGRKWRGGAMGSLPSHIIAALPFQKAFLISRGATSD